MSQFPAKSNTNIEELLLELYFLVPSRQMTNSTLLSHFKRTEEVIEDAQGHSNLFHSNIDTLND